MTMVMNAPTLNLQYMYNTNIYHTCKRDKV